MTATKIHSPPGAAHRSAWRSLFPSDGQPYGAPEPAPSFEALLAQSKQRFPEDRFRHISAVVVFAEHPAQLQDGRPVQYDRQTLERIAANCNRRIEQTGNWAAVCIGHTDHQQQQPKPLIGFAGPFRVSNQDGRAVITAELWIFQDQVDQLQYYPRPSPEVWIPTEGFQPDRIFLDPIAFLGADAPRLDLGMTFLYTAQADGGWTCEKYAASFPSPGSVIVPQQKDSYQKGTSPMLTPEDIQAILKAIEATDWYQWVRQQMAASQKPIEQASASSTQQPGSMPPPNPLPPQPSPPVPMADNKKEPYQAPAPPPALPQKEEEEEEEEEEENEQEKKKEEYRGGPGCKTHYSKDAEMRMQKEIYQLRQTLEAERALRINTERRRRLEQLARYYAVDVDEEMQLCQYSRMDDLAFTRHLERIERYYKPIPADQQLPAWAEGDAAIAGPAAASRELYQRQKQEDLSRQAAELARRLAQRGQWISYEEALQRVKTGQTIVN